jgi:hypothetical protein
MKKVILTLEDLKFLAKVKEKVTFETEKVNAMVDAQVPGDFQLTEDEFKDLTESVQAFDGEPEDNTYAEELFTKLTAEPAAEVPAEVPAEEPADGIKEEHTGTDEGKGTGKPEEEEVK